MGPTPWSMFITQWSIMVLDSKKVVSELLYRYIDSVGFDLAHTFELLYGEWRLSFSPLVLRQLSSVKYGLDKSP